MSISRYFSAEPTASTLTAIEGINIIEIVPPQVSTGAGAGTVCMIGEFEEGQYDTPTEVFGPTDLAQQFGGFGHVHDGKPYSNPIAQRSGGDEYWNGNGYLYVTRRPFTRLILVRAKITAGQVRFRRLACLTAPNKGPFNLEPGDTADYEVDGSPVQGTIDAEAGVILGSGGSYPTGFVGGEKLIILDERGVQRLVVFKNTDQTKSQVKAAINAQLAYTATGDNGADITLISRIRGRTGYIRLVGGTTSALTALGLTLTDTAEVDRITIVNNLAGTYTFTVAVWYLGVITTFTATYVAGGGDSKTVIRNALISNFNTTNPNAPVTLNANGTDKIDITSNVAGVGIVTTVTAAPNVGDMTTSNVTANSTSFGLGTGNVDNVDLVTSGEIAAILDPISGLTATIIPGGFLRLCNDATPEVGTLLVTGGAVNTALGFEVGDEAIASQGSEVLIPTGTRIRDTNGTVWVTCASYTTDTSGGSFLLDVRPAQDDDTSPTALADTATTLVDVLADGFEVTNPDPLVRMSAQQLDAAYRDAIESTDDPNGVSKDIDIIYSARTSAAIIGLLKDNVIKVSAEEHNLRKAIVSPPLATTKAQMRTDDTIGVLACRHQRVMYVGPGFVTYISEIAEVGTANGIGFTADGIIELRAEGYYASVRSILPPEENAGQFLSRTVYGRDLPVLGLCKQFNKKYGGTPLRTEDYKAFKAVGIIAPKINLGQGAQFQSDVTSVDPVLEIGKVSAARIFFFDFLANSFRDILRPYSKAQLTPELRRGAIAALNSFLSGLKGTDSPALRRILDGKAFDETNDASEAAGQFNIKVKVRMIPAALNINVRAAVGTSVTVTEDAA